MKAVTKAALARELGVSRGMLYYERKRERADDELRGAIEAVMMAHPGYGHRRIAMELKMNHKRILRVMKLFSLRPARRARSPSKPLDVGKEACSYPCITTAMCPIVPDIVWVSDFTFIPFHGRFVYLATVVDLFTKEVRGVSVMVRHTTELVLQALRMALREGMPEWFHSDQGSEYDSHLVYQELRSHGIKLSMSPKSSPWRNGAQESFFGRFKVEFGDPERFIQLGELIEAIYAFIAYYNTRRIHTRHKMAPATAREQWKERNRNLYKDLPGCPQVVSLPLWNPPHSHLSSNDKSNNNGDSLKATTDNFYLIQDVQ